MSQMLNRKYRNKCSLHVSDNFRNASLDSDLPPAALKAGNRDREAELYSCLGFLFTGNTHVGPLEYFDFYHTTWYLLDLKSDLKFGALPSGLLIRCPGGEVRVVLDSKLYLLDEHLEVLQ